MDQHVQAVAVQHQPLDDGLKLLGREDDLDVGDRMRADRLITEPADLDWALLAEDGAEPLGCRARPGRIVVDVCVITSVLDGVGGVAHGSSSYGWGPFHRTIERTIALRRVEGQAEKLVCSASIM